MNENFDREDLARNRIWAALGYLVFFVPLLLCRKSSRLARHCANQGLLLMIVRVLLGILFEILDNIPLVGWLFELIGGLAGFALLIVGLICTIQLISNDRVCELPFIGHIRLIR